MTSTQEPFLFTLAEQELPSHGIDIRVIGVGGCGGNIVNHFNRSAESKSGIQVYALNTDLKALQQSSVTSIQLGKSLTRGLGAGAIPEIGAEAAEESLAEIEQMLDGADLCFLAAGMGGGTGTGAAPIIAREARARGVLTVALVTRPFAFEGKKREASAQAGIELLEQEVDALLILPNDYLLKVLGGKTPLIEAFSASSMVIQNAVSGLAAIISQSGFINIDFADVNTILRQRGKAAIGVGMASGKDRTREAMEQALANPLLERLDLSRAQGILLNIVGGEDIGLLEYQMAGDMLQEMVGEEAMLVSGLSLDPEMGDRIQVSIIITGISDEPVAGAAEVHQEIPGILPREYIT
ncbi:cell division protein FtsZ [Dongshaea marina]|uniref:cell division protein FtsZ n=1 Tax=Dongshaea marina TaxID=2047966 RepID=UPI000D3E22FD|nr:cell division protein FtsZ [Dongshaea marina]